MRLYILFAGFALLRCACAQYQAPFNSSQLQGEVDHDPSAVIEGLIVEVIDRQRHQVIERAPVFADGRYAVRQVPFGSYEVRLTNQFGAVFQTQYVSVGPTNLPINFRLPPGHAATGSGSVSARDLGHRPNRKATGEFRKAEHSRLSGDVDGWIAHLQGSIAADGDFSAAHHELGVAWMRKGAPEKALVELTRSAELDPAMVPAHSNLAVVLFSLGRFREAELEARRTAQLDPTSAKAEYLIGLSLLQQHKSSTEALSHLRRAYTEFPNARALGERLESR